MIFWGSSRVILWISIFYHSSLQSTKPPGNFLENINTNYEFLSGDYPYKKVTVTGFAGINNSFQLLGKVKWIQMFLAELCFESWKVYHAICWGGTEVQIMLHNTNLTERYQNFSSPLAKFGMVLDKLFFISVNNCQSSTLKLLWNRKQR